MDLQQGEVLADYGSRDSGCIGEVVREDFLQAERTQSVQDPIVFGYPYDHVTIHAGFLIYVKKDTIKLIYLQYLALKNGEKIKNGKSINKYIL